MAKKPEIIEKEFTDDEKIEFEKKGLESATKMTEIRDRHKKALEKIGKSEIVSKEDLKNALELKKLDRDAVKNDDLTHMALDVKDPNLVLEVAKEVGHNIELQKLVRFDFS